MYREVIFSVIGHALVFGGFVLPSVIVGKSQPLTTIYSVKTITPEAIAQLLNKSAPQGTPKPKIPQVAVEPDKALPKNNWRPKQTVKQESSQPQDSSFGTQSGKQTQKSPVMGIDVDSEFNYPEYLIDLRDKIEKNWRPPTINTSLKTRVYFKLARDGNIIRTFVETPTGNITFDMAAMNAVTKSIPFPPLPDEFTGNEIGIHFDFIYEL